MKQVVLVLAIALVLGIAGGVWAAEEPVTQGKTEAVEVQAETQTADQWLEAQATVLPGALFAGEQCGGVVCGKFEYCCNPTCNACVPFGWGCTQEVCN